MLRRPPLEPRQQLIKVVNTVPPAMQTKKPMIFQALLDMTETAMSTVHRKAAEAANNQLGVSNQAGGLGLAIQQATTWQPMNDLTAQDRHRTSLNDNSQAEAGQQKLESCLSSKKRAPVPGIRMGESTTSRDFTFTRMVASLTQMAIFSISMATMSSEAIMMTATIIILPRRPSECRHKWPNLLRKRSQA